jgi:putative glutamine amidotransferase
MLEQSRSPMIGISTYGRKEPSPFSLPSVYIDAVRAAGGVPVLLPPGETDPALLLEHLDGLIIPGGGDIDPSWYYGDSHHSIYCVDLERDAFELGLAKFALENYLPVLGICRGLQIMIVVSGGTLIPHVPDEYFGVHRLDPEPGKRYPTEHQVQIVLGESRLAKITESTKFSVVSWHHQGVRTVPESWNIVAHSLEDGLIEAIEHQHHPWAIGVQWHPELSPTSPEHQRIFKAFVAATKDNKKGNIAASKNENKNYIKLNLMSKNKIA